MLFFFNTALHTPFSGSKVYYLFYLLSFKQLEDDIALNAEEQEAVASMRNHILMDNALAQRVSDEMVVQFLMARKFEEPRAMELLTNSKYPKG
jgi:hypothetical protein